MAARRQRKQQRRYVDLAADRPVARHGGVLRDRDGIEKPRGQKLARAAVVGRRRFAPPCRRFAAQCTFRLVGIGRRLHRCPER
jgi:hypothetical protein